MEVGKRVLDKTETKSWRPSFLSLASELSRNFGPGPFFATEIFLHSQLIPLSLHYASGRLATLLHNIYSNRRGGVLKLRCSPSC